MLKRLALALGFVATVGLTSSCDPCSVLCCLLLTNGGGGGQASLPVQSPILRGNSMTPQAEAIAEHVVSQAKPGAQKF